MPRKPRVDIALVTVGAVGLLLAGCTPASVPPAPSGSRVSSSVPAASSAGGRPSGSVPASSRPATPGTVRLGFAGDVHFAERTAALLADPATAFGPAAAVLSAPDLTMVNLETAIAVGGRPEAKSFTFQAPPSAFAALRAAGVDVVTMANNHAADYGSAGLAQTLAAIRDTGFPVVGIGSDAKAAYAPYYTQVNGVRLAIVAASQVREETLAHFTATDSAPGIANAYSDRLTAAVWAARTRADVVVVYLHWGTEYQSCPNSDQRALADRLVAAGATAVVGSHAHVLQGAGWRPDGSYVAYGLGNYLWWRSFGNTQDDNGVLTLTFTRGRVVSAAFAPARLDERGIAVPVTGAVAQRILGQWDQARQCAGLLATPPG
ncbi:CapA family protein [Jatrophihabitans sp.]|uniref:CapA family protein n=1 Tax=Jatrophihabitans sp. TaxID=1932789 RepID=UPI002C43A0FC|nr:CapA family protein [Jatrophihabitans sp.]